jgi:hypothetical protein
VRWRAPSCGQAIGLPLDPWPPRVAEAPLLKGGRLRPSLATRSALDCGGAARTPCTPPHLELDGRGSRYCLKRAAAPRRPWPLRSAAGQTTPPPTSAPPCRQRPDSRPACQPTGCLRVRAKRQRRTGHAPWSAACAARSRAALKTYRKFEQDLASDLGIRPGTQRSVLALRQPTVSLAG